MMDREAALRSIGIGDIFHACIHPDSGPSYICLALQVREDAILARRMTTQSVHWFDRATGAEIEDGRVVIDSVAPLPGDIHEIMLGLDRKFQEIEFRQAEDPDWEPPEGSSRLTPEQRRAFSFIAEFYPAHLLPPRQLLPAVCTGCEGPWAARIGV
jgi:hypothetical protein